MSLQALTYIAVGASFALYIGIAFWSKAHTTGDFYGRDVHGAWGDGPTALEMTEGID